MYKEKLPLVEDFYTIQGEGYHMGKAAYFIRVGGCDIGCSWCDTKFSWRHDLHPLVHVKDIVEKIVFHKADSVVVTGGEPTSYDLEYLCSELSEKGIKKFLETSGAYPLTGNWDWICLSPKKRIPPLEEFYKKANELKVIISSKEDFEWAEQNANLVNENCLLYLQPEWSRYEKIIGDLVDYVLLNTKWNISLQAHKFMHIP